MGCGWSIFFFIAFCATMATGETVLCIISAVLMVWTFFNGIKNQPEKPPVKPGNKSRGNGGSAYEGSYEGSTHYGTDTSGAPTTVHTSYGRTVDTTGTYWRERPDGSRENIFGETVEKNAYGQWEYTDSDGDTDDRATFDWD